METIRAKYLDDNGSKQYIDLLALKKLPPKLDPAAKPFVEQITWAINTSREDSAAVWIDRALADAPADWRIYYLSGLLSNRREQYAGAVTVLQSSLSLAPDNETARALIYLSLAESHEHQGHYGQAKQHYMTALNLEPESPEARSGLKRLMLLTSAGSE